MIGRQIAHYEVVAKLGEGGMGEVYRARDSRLDRTVAIKVLPPEFVKDPERLARFRREARLLASLHHTQIAGLHGLEEADGEVFLVMECVEGEDLAARLARGPLDLDESLELARQFAEGLEAAHEQNIVHRDLKPANLKLTPDGQLKILDFGLARAYLGDGADQEDLEHSPTITAALTGQGVILGTAAYMSPEQARGRKIDQRTDIWAFGAILFEMLTGQRLFQGETISDTMAAVLRAEPPWDLLPSDTPHGVRRLLERCLERDHRRRLRDIGEARVRLERWREDPQSLHESYVSGVHTPVAAARRRFPLPWVLLALAGAAIVVLAWQLRGPTEFTPPLMDLALAVVDGGELGTGGQGVALSPDARWMIWRTDRGVWVRALHEPQARLIEDTESVVCLDFSPDSQWLALAGGGQLRRVSVGGGTPIAICDAPTPRGVAWVDDRTIVFSPGISEGLMVVDLGTGETRRLTELDEQRNERSHRWPTAIPGRRAVAFECQFLGRDYDQSDVQVVAIDGGERQTVLRGGAAPRVSAQGQLLFVRANTLFAVGFDTDRLETSGLPLPARENIVSSVGNQEDDDGSAQFAIAHDGTLLYVDNQGAGTTTSRLAWLDLASGEIEPFGPSALQTGFVLAPNGDLVVLARRRDGEENLYVRDLTTGNESMLTYRASVEYIGAWSPDSRTFYWSQSSDAGDRFEVWRRPVDGSSPPEFVAASPTPAGVWPTDVSPDGRWLACAAWMGADLRDILILDLQDPEAGFQPFAGNARDQNGLRWFDDGVVVYRESRSGPGSILVRHFPDDGALWSLPDTEAGYWSATRAEDGESLLVEGSGVLFRFPFAVDGGRVRIGQPEVLHRLIPEVERRLAWFEPHPDGRRGLCLYSDDTSGVRSAPRLTLVTGWLQDVSARLERSR